MNHELVTAALPHLAFHTLVTCPTKTHGFSVARKRSLLFGHDPRTLCWVGPDPAEFEQEFHALFFAKVAMSVETLLDSDKHHDDFIIEIARSRGIYLKPGEPLPTIDELLPPGGLERKQEWDRVFETACEKSTSGDVDMVADLGQDHSSRPRYSLGKTLKCQLQQTMNFNLGAQKVMSPWLMLRLHGWREDSFLLSSGQTCRDLQAYCGDGMHLACNAAFFFYCVSCLVPVATIQGSPMAKLDALATETDDDKAY